MTNVNRSIAKGAAWMALFKVAERSIGVASTVILARLLLPADFGLIAMAMSFVAILELLWAFSFDAALIQNRSESRTYYDTAWTLNVCLGLTVAVALVGVSYPAAAFYGDPRLVPVIICLAVGVLFQGFENIGVVAFRKELRFGMEFRYQIARKIVGFLVAVPLAFALRNYWALVAGIVISRVASVIISYAVHPFRPRLSLAARDALFGFSKWLFLNNLLFAIQMRSQDFVVGKISGTSGLGLYTVAYEVSTLPTSEIVGPINRAVFPGFAKLASEPFALVQAYLRVVGMTALLTLPAGLGIAATAELIVPVVFGERWLDAVPIIEILSIYGALAALASVFGPTFLALGRPRILSVFTVFNVALFVPIVIYGTINHGVLGAAWGCLAVVTVTTPASHWFACRVLKLPVRSIVAQLWRPGFAALVMFAFVRVFVQWANPIGASLSLVAELVAAIALGAIVYSTTLLGFWLLSDRPDGAESTLLNEVRSRFRNT